MSSPGIYIKILEDGGSVLGSQGKKQGTCTRIAEFLSQMQVCGEEDGCCTLEDDKYGVINKSHGPPNKVQ